MVRVWVGSYSLEGKAAGHITQNACTVAGCIKEMTASWNDGRTCLIRDTLAPLYSSIRAVATSLGQSALPFERRAIGFVGDNWYWVVVASILTWPVGWRWVFPVCQFLYCLRDRVLFFHAWRPEGCLNKQCSTRWRRARSPLPRGLVDPT